MKKQPLVLENGLSIANVIDVMIEIKGEYLVLSDVIVDRACVCFSREGRFPRFFIMIAGPEYIVEVSERVWVEAKQRIAGFLRSLAREVG